MYATTWPGCPCSDPGGSGLELLSTREKVTLRNKSKSGEEEPRLGVR